jgi:hypothetical protein
MLFKAQDGDPVDTVVAMVPAELPPLPATPSSTVQRPRKSMQAAAHRADSIQLSSEIEFTSEIVREKVNAKVREM